MGPQLGPHAVLEGVNPGNTRAGLSSDLRPDTAGAWLASLFCLHPLASIAQTLKPRGSQQPAGVASLRFPCHVPSQGTPGAGSLGTSETLRPCSHDGSPGWEEALHGDRPCVTAGSSSGRI